ncbi:sensor histidine kinase [Aquimonas voraii]|uniref:histidine kinase n=1 Tax=Aquimonas voraii TaxID=265719 RepID=A0A1G6ZHN8_9GAMM|nr:ATP-binding protein [Aquimonas voraii]SDE02234.1 PAS domain S-box-containing protein [Aquimonas voraii]
MKDALTPSRAWMGIALEVLEAALASSRADDLLERLLRGLMGLHGLSAAALLRASSTGAAAPPVLLARSGRPPSAAADEEEAWRRLLAKLQRPASSLSSGLHRFELTTAEAEVWILALQGPAGAPAGALAVEATDALRLAARVHAAAKRQEDAHQARRRLESLLEATGAGTWEWEVQSGRARMNTRWAEIVGQSLEALAPLSVDTWMDQVHPDDLLLCSRSIEAHLAGTTPRYEATYRVRHREGYWVWVHDCGQVVRFSGDGRPELMVGSQIDISRAKQTEDELQRSLQALRTYSALLDAAGRMAGIGGWSYLPGEPGPLWTDEVCRIHEVDPGYRPRLDEAIGFYAVECRPRIQQALDACIAEGTPWDLELEIVTAKGNRRWVRAQGEAERDAGEIRMLRGAFQDITERKSLLEALEAGKRELEARVRARTAELETARQHAEDASRAKDEFLTNISHELRSPLHSVLGFTGLALEELESADRDTLQRFLEKAKASATELLKLVNDLLDAAKIESGRLVIQPEETELETIVDAVIGEFEVAAANKGLCVRKTLVPQGRVMADPGRLGQALRNVIANAVRFSPKGGAVHVEARTVEAGALQLRVSDQGPGIPEAELESVFDRFTQSSRTKTGAGGTGLGLPIARGILELHGGRLWAERPEGGGSSFVMELPSP